MFANSRMFWNVRPIPKRTISLGRALRKIPARCRRCTYHGGRMIATMSEPIRSPIDISTSSSPPISRRAAMLTAAKTPNTTGKANQKNGSAQVRRGRDTTGSPANEIVPSLGSRQAGDDVEERRLARPVGTDEAHDRALGDVEVDRAHRDEAAEPLRDPTGVEQQTAAGRVGRGGVGRGRCRRRGRRFGGGRRRGGGGCRGAVVSRSGRVDAWIHRLGHPSDLSSGSIRAVGSAAVSSSSAGVSWSSRRLRRLGNRPSGLNSIIPTSARPYSRYW